MPNNRVTAYLQDPIHCVSNHQEKHAILRKQETKYNSNSFVNFSQDLTTKRGNHHLPKPTATKALKKNRDFPATKTIYFFSLTLATFFTLMYTTYFKRLKAQLR